MSLFLLWTTLCPKGYDYLMVVCTKIVFQMRGLPFLIIFQDIPYSKPTLALSYDIVYLVYFVLLLNEIWSPLATDHDHFWHLTGAVWVCCRRDYTAYQISICTHKF